MILKQLMDQLKSNTGENTVQQTLCDPVTVELPVCVLVRVTLAADGTYSFEIQSFECGPCEDCSGECVDIDFGAGTLTFDISLNVLLEVTVGLVPSPTTIDCYCDITGIADISCG